MVNTCIVHQAFRKARQELEWLGVADTDTRVRSFAAARLRFTSLVRPEEADLLMELAHVVETTGLACCPTCGMEFGKAGG